MKMTNNMRAKCDTVHAAFEAWQRGEINQREWQRRADVTDEQCKAIEAKFKQLDYTAAMIHIANTLYPEIV